mgnify:CR=1 FL=1
MGKSGRGPKLFELRENPLSAIATSRYVAPAVAGVVARLSEGEAKPPYTACSFAALSVLYAFLAEASQRASDQIEQADAGQARVIGGYLKDNFQKILLQATRVAECVTDPEGLATFVVTLDYRAVFIRNVIEVLDGLLRDLQEIVPDLIDVIPENLRPTVQKYLEEAGIALGD